MELDDNTWYEIKAAAFYRDCHMLAPGKDQAALAMGPSHEERMRVWGDWCINNEEIIAAFKQAIERVL